MNRELRLGVLVLATLVAMLGISLAQRNLPGVVYVGEGVGAWGAGDIGAQINLAYGALPRTGGTISLLPRSDGGCYQFSTTIQFTTVGKHVILQGLAPSTSQNSDPGGACLNFTTTSVSSAMVIDWTPSYGGGYATGAGLRDITLVNSIPGQQGVACSKVGGCGSQAQGIQIGGTNGGMAEGLFSNVKVQGFESAYKIEDGLGTSSAGVGWGITWFHCSTVWNAIGLNYVVAHELDQYMSGNLNSNWEAVALFAWGGELLITGASIDDNSGCGVFMSDGAIVHLAYVHFENTSNGATAYVCGDSGVASAVDISGGIAYDDVGSGMNSTVHWFRAGMISAQGLILTSFGRTTSTSIFAAAVSGKYGVLNRSPTFLPQIKP